MTQRMTALMDRPFVVFLIGMRINKWWRPDLWLPVALSMPKMIAELEASPEQGLLGWESGGIGNPSVMIQYWRSTDDLMRYARSQDHEHLPAWAAFRKRVASTDAVGVWHETFVVSPGSCESVYANMPAFGLGKIGALVPANGELATARRRLAAGGREPAVAA